MSISNYLRWACGIFNPINMIIPKNPRRVVFYSNLGFRDNVRAVYDYMVDEELYKKYEIVCSCNDYKEYQSNIKNIRFVSPIRGFFYFLTSKYLFYSFGKYPVVPAPNQTVINLWHGSPLKSIGAYNKNEEQKKQDYFSYVLAASPFFVPVMANSFHVDSEKVIVCGHGRNDNLFKDCSLLKERFNTESYSKIILWLPTFRKQSGKTSDSIENDSETKLAIFDTWSALDELNDHLKSLNMYCIIKLHPLQEWSSQTKGEYSNILFFTHQEFAQQKLDLYRVLPLADALITDYSSVYFDYLLLDRPIAFTIEDISDYADKRGFIFDNPLEYMPGPKIQTKGGFFMFLEACLAGKDDYREKRKKVNDLCNYYKDGNNCKRILQKVNMID